MTNVAFESIEDYKDIEIINYYNEAVNEYGRNPEDVLKLVYPIVRDNANGTIQKNPVRFTMLKSLKP